jgi:hypothetical protein
MAANTTDQGRRELVETTEERGSQRKSAYERVLRS